jgi:hypothetical protein
MSGGGTTSPLGVGDIVRMLALRIDQLVIDLLPAGRQEGHEWRCGSIAGEAGRSLGIHLTGAKAGIWSDFATGQAGDSLDLIKDHLGLDTADAIAWARRWLGLDEGEATIPRSAHTASPSTSADPPHDPNRWRWPWEAAAPLASTKAETYLAARGLEFLDPAGEVLRYAARRARKSPAGDLEHHPALLALLCDICTGESCGIVNVYLAEDGRSRLRDAKGKTVTGRARGAAVMLSAFEEPTYGLTVCEGTETGLALLMADLAPVWCCGGAGNLAAFPLLGGIEALTIAADADEPGQKAAEAIAARWREAGREAAIIAPPTGDWADGRR